MQRSDGAANWRGGWVPPQYTPPPPIGRFGVTRRTLGPANWRGGGACYPPFFPWKGGALFDRQNPPVGGVVFYLLFGEGTLFGVRLFGGGLPCLPLVVAPLLYLPSKEFFYGGESAEENLGLFPKGNPRLYPPPIFGQKRGRGQRGGGAWQYM